MKRYLLVVLLLSGCSSVQHSAVVPQPVVASTASFDGNVQNSGIVSAGAKGFHVTPHFLARYDAMLTVNGLHISPPRKAGDREGITVEPGGYVFDAEAMNRFVELNRLRTSGEAP